MKIIILLIVTIAMNIFSQQDTPKTVKYVDIKKYAGLWYEIAKIPNRFQKQCVKGTTALYELKENGEIRVINSCYDKDNELDKTEGVARIVDNKSNAKLEVSFFSILGWRPIWGDYWIIGLDENYQWAIIGTQNRKYGWILSRTSKLDETTMNKIFEILKDQGYNPKDFEMDKL
ncbi:MAG TPA: lipocalin family protein [Ignavibacteriaceae bacterium]|nr:lipocalin family protein [Ignavibacteriaceae bacterium]